MRTAPFIAAGFAAVVLGAQVLTSQYDNARSGANTRETTLTPANVNAAGFGRLFRWAVDGDVYAQPLYLRDVDVPGRGRHDVVVVATEHDSVYAFDAGGQPLEPLWHTSFTGGQAEPIPASDLMCPFISPEIGITSTPAIDPATGAVYVLARTRERSGGEWRFYQRLHALDVRDGRERPASPVLIRASVESRNAGFLGMFSGTVSFNAFKENPRAALTFAGGAVWLTWASSCDYGPYHGWVIAYDGRTLRQTGVFNTSPESVESGIWASDTGPAVDERGYFYVSTGNGRFDASNGGRDYGDSVLKLRLGRSGLTLADYFTPFNQENLNDTDKDLGSGGVVVLPEQPGAHRHLLIAAGKEGVIYLLDRDRMGGFHAGSNTQAVQTVKMNGAFFSAPAFWNNRLYVVAGGDVPKAFTLENGRLSAAPVSQAGGRFHEPGATPVVSANGTRDGIVWAIESHGWAPADPATLHAWDALNLGRELYNSRENFSRDAAGSALRFTIPTVAGGRVYVGAKGQVTVYGLLRQR